MNPRDRPPEGTHVRIYLTSRRVLDGILGPEIGEGQVAFTRDRTGETVSIPWGEIYTFHRLDPRGAFVGKQASLPLEGLR